jgi:hypothetical protein
MRCMLSCRDERRGGEMGPTLDGRGLRSRLGMAGGVVFYAVTLIVHSYTTPTKSYAFAHVCPDILEGIRRTQRTTTQALFPPESQALYLASLNHHLVHSFRPTPIRPFLGSQGSPAPHTSPQKNRPSARHTPPPRHRLPASARQVQQSSRQLRRTVKIETTCGIINLIVSLPLSSVSHRRREKRSGRGKLER